MKAAYQLRRLYPLAVSNGGTRNSILNFLFTSGNPMSSVVSLYLFSAGKATIFPLSSRST